MSITGDLEKRIWNDIALYGWHVIKVQEDEYGPSLVHSIGFTHSFKHPEVLVIGLDIEAAHLLINRLGDAIRDGLELQSGQFYSNLIESVDCYFTSVEAANYDEYAGYAKQFYGENNFSLLQCIYPTLSNVYPWQTEWPEQLKQQPILGPTPSASQGEVRQIARMSEPRLGGNG